MTVLDKTVHIIKSGYNRNRITLFIYLPQTEQLNLVVTLLTCIQEVVCLMNHGCAQFS